MINGEVSTIAGAGFSCIERYNLAMGVVDDVVSYCRILSRRRCALAVKGRRIGRKRRTLPQKRQRKIR